MEPYQLTLSARGSGIDVNLALGAPRRPAATVLRGNPCDAVSMHRRCRKRSPDVFAGWQRPPSIRNLAMTSTDFNSSTQTNLPIDRLV